MQYSTATKAQSTSTTNMPSGVHNNHTDKGGGKPTCTCESKYCKLCMHREASRRWRASRGIGRWREYLKDEISDEVLEQRLVDKFKQMGWD